MRFRRVILAAALLGLCLSRAGAEISWPMEKLLEAPKTYPAPEFAVEGVEPLFYEALPWEGKPTRAFAYVGMPERKGDEKVPGIVLVHGGGGTAFVDWVKLWTSRGYAAIAMDNCGSVPGGQHGKRPRQELGGPPGWGGFDQTSKAPEDQWTYHAVADVLLAHSLLRSRAEVDPERIGITGISWGGYLTCIAAGVDSRFRFAAPVYGCGFLGENSAWLGEFAKLGPEAAKAWLQRWDPSVYLPKVKVPMLWVTGTNDFAYPMDSLRKSYRLPKTPRTLCIRVKMPHGHGGPGEKPVEIHAFADHVVKGGPALAKVSTPKLAEGSVSVTFESPVRIAKAELNLTRDTGPWQKRQWETVPAELDAAKHEARAGIPAGARAAYVNFTDEHGLVVSSEHVELAATAR